MGRQTMEDQSDKALFERGLSLYSKGQFAEALPYFLRLTDSNYTLLRHYHLGLTYVQLGRLDEGLAEYKKIREIPPDTMGVGYDQLLYGLYLHMGSALQVLAKKHGRGLYSEAVECYWQALEVDDRAERVWNNLGNAYIELGQYLEAIKALKRAIAIEDEYPEAYYSLSLAYEFLGEYGAAIANLKNALTWKAKNRVILSRIIALLFGTGEMLEARHYASQAVQEYPEDPVIVKNLALILYNLGEYKESYIYYKKLMGLQPTFADPQVDPIFEDLCTRVSAGVPPK